MYWQPADYEKRLKIEKWRKRLSSERVTQPESFNLWRPRFPIGSKIPLLPRDFGQFEEPPQSFQERAPAWMGKVQEFLTGRPVGWIPRTPGEVLGTTGVAAVMAVPPLKVAGGAVGLTGKALGVAGKVDIALNPFEWLRKTARVIGGIGRAIRPMPVEVERIGLQAQAERVAQESLLVKGGDWGPFLKLVEDVTGKRIGAKPKGIPKAPKVTRQDFIIKPEEEIGVGRVFRVYDKAGNKQLIDFRSREQAEQAIETALQAIPKAKPTVPQPLEVFTYPKTPYNPQLAEDFIKSVPELTSVQADLIRQYAEVIWKAQLAEKFGGKVTPKMLKVYREGDWETFSRARGYTEAEIAVFSKGVRLKDRGIELGIPEDTLAAVVHEVNQTLARRYPKIAKAMETGAGVPGSFTIIPKVKPIPKETRAILAKKTPITEQQIEELGKKGQFPELTVFEGKTYLATDFTAEESRILTQARMKVEAVPIPKPEPGLPTAEVIGKAPEYIKALKALTNEEWQKVITALGGDKPIRLPSQGGLIGVKPLANELTSYLGGPQGIPKIITPETLAKPWTRRIGERLRSAVLATDRMKRIISASDKGDYNGKMSQVFIHPTEDAMGNRLSHVFGWTDNYAKVLKETDLKLGRMVEAGGLKLRSSTRIGIALNSKNEQNKFHMMWSNALSEKQIADVTASLSPQEQRVVAFYEQWAKDIYPRMAQAYKYATGKTLPQVDNYWPILIERDARLVSPEKMGDFSYILGREAELRKLKRWPSQMVSKGMTKARRARAFGALELDAEAVFLKRMLDTEHYIAMMPTIMDLQKIHANPLFRQALSTQMGEGVWRQLGEWLTDASMTRPRPTGATLEGLPRFFREVGATGAIGLNLLSVMRQPLAMFTAMPEVGAVPIFRGLVEHLVSPKETLGAITRLSPVARDRLRAGYVAEAKVFESIGREIGKYGRFRAKSQEIGLLMATASDRYTTAAVWRAAFEKQLRVGMEEKVAARYADDVLRRTQAMFNVLDMPSLYRRGSEWTKALLVFTNQLNQNWNYFRYDVLNLWGEKKITSPQAVGKFVEAVVIAGLLEGWITRSTPPDDWKDVGTDIADYMFTQIPLVGPIIRSAEIGVTRMGTITTAPIEVGQRLGQQVAKGEWAKAAASTGELSAYLAGLPVTQPRRTIKAIIEIAQGKSDDWLSLIWGSWRREQEAKERLRKQGIPIRGKMPARRRI